MPCRNIYVDFTSILHSVIAHPHTLMRATNERFLPATTTFRAGPAGEWEPMVATNVGTHRSLVDRCVGYYSVGPSSVVWSELRALPFPTNEGAFSDLVTGPQSHVWSGPQLLFKWYRIQRDGPPIHGLVDTVRTQLVYHLPTNTNNQMLRFHHVLPASSPGPRF